MTRDGYNLEYSEVKPIGSASPEDPRGYIKEYTQNFSEMNLNYLIGFNKTFGDWSVGAYFRWKPSEKYYKEIRSG